MIDAATKNAFLALVAADRRARCEKALEDLELALTERKIYNVALQDIKDTLNRAVHDAYDYGGVFGRPSREELYTNFEPTELGKLTNSINLYGIRDAIATAKKLAKTKVVHPWVDRARAFTAAILPIAVAIETAKPFIVKGRVPSEKVVERTGREGTCPVCFGEYQTNGKGLVNHGFERPGCGYLVGRCFGVAFPKFETSTKGSVAWIRELEKFLAANLKQQAAWKNDEVESTIFTYSVESGRDLYGRRQSRPELVTVVKGAPATEIERADAATRKSYQEKTIKVPSFADLKKVAQAELKGQEKAIRGDLEQMQGMVKSWKPGWKRPVGW